MADVNVRVRFELVEREPDGSACSVCGDIAWLRAYDLVFGYFGKQPLIAGQVCQSCAELFEPDDDPKSE